MTWLHFRNVLLWFIACHMHRDCDARTAVVMVYDVNSPDVVFFQDKDTAWNWMIKQPLCDGGVDACTINGVAKRPWYELEDTFTHPFEEEGDQCDFR